MQRRDLIKLGAAAAASSLQPILNALPNPSPLATLPQWDLFELTLQGPVTGNPFKDVTLQADFTLDHRTIRVTGFYDGAGTYRIRFMPDAQGRWTYRTLSPTPALDDHTGTLEVTAPGPGNHGPVTTARQFHFQYADGSPYFPFGTTTYAFLFATEPNVQASLAGMRTSRFNKARACILPKPIGKGPELLPFPAGDLTRLDPTYFQLLDRRILDLQRAGVEADLILFHPYDTWGYKSMPPAVDDFYLRYVIARFSAYRNVWWSLANEFDLIKSKTTADWDRLFRITQAEDPYGHLRSIHHSHVMYDHSHPWCTHASLQSYDFEKSASRREAWNKPIIYDEIQYEGDIDRRWGNLSHEELTHRFWLATVRGTYATHGEVFATPYEASTTIATSADCGPERGLAGPRIAFLRTLIESATTTGFNESEGAYYLNAVDQAGNILYYFDYHRPARYDFPLPPNATFTATLIDPIGMTQTALPGTHTGKSRIALPSLPYRAVLFTKTGDTKAKPDQTPQPKVPTNEPL